MVFRSPKTGRWTDEARVVALGIVGALLIIFVVGPVLDRMVTQDLPKSIQE